MLKKILNKFDGLHYKQEYLCLDDHSFDSRQHFYIVKNGEILSDITTCHSFVGYSPLIIAIPGNCLASPPEELQVISTNRYYNKNDKFISKDAQGQLRLKKNHSWIDAAFSLTFYKGIDGKQHFIPLLNRKIGGLLNNIYNKKPGNVFLDNNLYQQVKIAYSYPRKISLITVTRDGYFNLFPTDLHGPAGDDYYIISLRYEGFACKQVEHAGEILLSEMAPAAYKMVYGLGKNHMQPLKTAESFPFGPGTGNSFHLPVPEDAISYRELKLVYGFIEGIHRVMIFRVVNRQVINPERGVLAHVHNAYGTWRFKSGLPGNYLLR